MLKILFFTLIGGLLSWAVFERSKWYEDYSQYEAPFLDFGPIDTTFQSHFNPKLFNESLVISNSDLSALPEDVAVSQDGIVYTGLHDGSIVEISQNGETKLLHKNKETGGVFGIILADNDQTLFYVTEKMGLCRFDISSKKEQQLVSQIGQKKLIALNNLCLDEERQVIYMTDSTPFPMKHASKDILLKHKKGRILYYNLVTKQSGVFAEDLAYPNGIVFDKASQSLIFSEMSHFKLTKIPGANPSERKTLLDNIFGYPDNLEMNEAGQLYIGVPAVRDQGTQKLNQKPGVRKFLMFVPQRLLTLSLRKIAGGIKVDPISGEIKEYIFGDPKVSYSITTLLQRNGKIYMPSLRCPTIIVLNHQTKNGSINQEAQNVEVSNSNDL